MAETNKAVVRRYFDELGNRGELSAADELFAPTYGRPSAHVPAEAQHGPQRARWTWATWRNAFPDWSVDVDVLVAEGDVVAARIAARGTHLGELVRPGFTLVAPWSALMLAPQLPHVPMAGGLNA